MLPPVRCLRKRECDANGCLQVREEAEAVATRCKADIRVSSLAVDSAAVQRDIFLHIGQVVISTPGQVAQVQSAHHCLSPLSCCPGTTFMYITSPIHSIAILPATGEGRVSPFACYNTRGWCLFLDILPRFELECAPQALKEGRLRAASFQPDERMRRPGLSTLVLDEADLMLSMPGYEEDLQAIAPLVSLHACLLVVLYSQVKEAPLSV